jgi:hypothetical protein
MSVRRGEGKTINKFYAAMSVRRGEGGTINKFYAADVCTKGRGRDNVLFFIFY